MVSASNNSLLHNQRRNLEQNWCDFVTVESQNKNINVRPEILSSWERCSKTECLSIDCDSVPSGDDYVVKHRWQNSIIKEVSQKELDEIKQLSKNGSLVAAISDLQGNLLWTCASQHMIKRAESVNFIQGGNWGECTAGTNSIGLSLLLKSPITVFSSEHYLSLVHDWVCYAAPIIQPQSGKVVGILDLSSTWDNHTILGQAAVCQLANSIAMRLPQSQPKAELEILALGATKVKFRGKILHMTHRQVEILCLLVLNPGGLSLDTLHAFLYGDLKVCKSTLKAEISHLRFLLDGQIGSRPYRLTVSVWGDFLAFWEAIQQDKTEEAISHYGGAFLPKSNSPELEDWQRGIEAAMTELSKCCQK